ncbi:MAG: glycosyltransferase family 9 protein [Duncaniella sp.]|nr:glycosyltransferase family 9 protein [Duncaniella sp.]
MTETTKSTPTPATTAPHDASSTPRRKRLLAIRFSALGDVAMTIPVIYSVARAYPELEIYVATRPLFARLFVNPPANVMVIPFDIKEKYNGVGGLLGIARRLGALHPDYVADLHDVLRSWLLAEYFKLKDARVGLVNKDRRNRDLVFAGGRPQRPYIDRYFDVFDSLGFPASRTFRSIYEGSEAPKPAIEIKHPAIGIAPFARYATKTYPAEKMSKVVDTLAARGYNVYLFGARGAEAEMLRSWQKEGVSSVAGQFDLAGELATINALDLMVSMDSANQHLAALVDTPVLSIWGSTTPACGFLGYNQTAPADTVMLTLPCQPCSIAGDKKCPRGTLDCLRSIPSTAIVEAISQKVPLPKK